MCLVSGIWMMYSNNKYSVIQRFAITSCHVTLVFLCFLCCFSGVQPVCLLPDGSERCGRGVRWSHSTLSRPQLPVRGTHRYTHTNTHTHPHKQTLVHIHTIKYTHTVTHTHSCKHTHLHTYAHVNSDIHTHIHTQAHTRVSLYLQSDKDALYLLPASLFFLKNTNKQHHRGLVGLTAFCRV